MIATLPPLNCATGTLDPYIPSVDIPWNQKRAQHLFRRLGFGANQSTINDALSASPTALVDQLIDQAIAAPNLPQPSWHDWTIDDYADPNTEATEQLFEYARQWVEKMLATSEAPREKIALFWHNHFVTRFEDYACPSYMYSYHQLLQTYSLGNFRDFIYEIGKTPAMLLFLNGVQNTSFEPNENYARELYELFSLGQDNGYTQNDIVETARALTGWNGFTTLCAPIGYVDFLHDQGEKTIFEQTGNWDYDDVHNILFEQRATQISEHICGKIYRHFVHPLIDEDIVSGLAQTLRDNDWELAPVFRQVFKSEHFFDEEVIGVQIKSHIGSLNQLVVESELPYNQDVLDAVIFASYQLGQGLFNPVDVAGWPGDRDWVNTNTITGRWQGADIFIFTAFESAPQLLVSLAQALSNNSNDPALITQVIIDFLTPKGLQTPEAYDAATTVLKWEVPQNYYDSGLWNLSWDTAPAQVALLVRYISRLPEYQLS